MRNNCIFEQLRNNNMDVIAYITNGLEYSCVIHLLKNNLPESVVSTHDSEPQFHFGPLATAKVKIITIPILDKR